VTHVTPFSLSRYLAEERAEVERALDRVLTSVERTLPPDVARGVRHGVSSGGKRLRPILCATAFRACGGASEPDRLYDFAISVELIHAYSLVHDDLPCMDDAELRRGEPTTHRAVGEVLAIRAGAALIPLAALQCVTGLRGLGRSPAVVREATMALLRASGAGGMVGGQWLDLMGEGEALDAAALDGLHARKTGALLAASLVMGALAAEADPATVRRLEEYGRAIGLAFQIADDVLDATQSAEILGKNPSDAALDKSTYVSLHGLEEARDRATAAVDEALRALHRSDVRAPALEALARYVIERRH